MLNSCSHGKEDERDVMASNVNSNICSSNANSPSDLSTIKPLITRRIQRESITKLHRSLCKLPVLPDTGT